MRQKRHQKKKSKRKQKKSIVLPGTPHLVSPTMHLFTQIAKQVYKVSFHMMARMIRVQYTMILVI